jgi:hypothetical protein
MDPASTERSTPCEAMGEVPQKLSRGNSCDGLLRCSLDTAKRLAPGTSSDQVIVVSRRSDQRQIAPRSLGAGFLLFIPFIQASNAWAPFPSSAQCVPPGVRRVPAAG